MVSSQYHTKEIKTDISKVLSVCCSCSLNGLSFDITSQLCAQLLLNKTTSLFFAAFLSLETQFAKIINPTLMIRRAHQSHGEGHSSPRRAAIPIRKQKPCEGQVQGLIPFLFPLPFAQQCLAQFPVGTTTARDLLVQLTFIAFLQVFKISATQAALV